MLNWERDGADWPNRAASRILSPPGRRWHVQRMGAGPKLLLLHGAGAATHSWRDLAPDLASGFEIFAPDLPGQGFSTAPGPESCGLDAMARDLTALLAAEGFAPDLIVGHSAGAAIALRLALETPRPIIALNGAFEPFGGSAGFIFRPMAKALSATPFAATLFAATASSPRAVARLIGSTGSRLEARGLEFYRRLISDSGHVDATLAMMARWELEPLLAAAPALAAPARFFAGLSDGAVPPDGARRLARRIGAHAGLREFPGLGHLMHEEAPALFADAIREAAAEMGAPAGGVAGFQNN